MRPSSATVGAMIAVALVSGCGITLDLDPQPPPPAADVDAGNGRRDAALPRRDGGGVDSDVPIDDGGRFADGNLGMTDGSPPMLDAGPATCPMTPCDHVHQCGCGDLTMPTCDIDPSTETTFCRAAGSVPRDGACIDNAECPVGLVCLEIDASVPEMPGAGVCTSFCDADIDCGGTGGVCLPVFSASGVCTTGCDPIAVSGCPLGLECAFGFDGTFCRSGSGFGGVGTTCFFSEDCDAGTVCDTSTAVPGVCRELCRTDGDCAGGAAGSCVHMWIFVRDPLGVCLVG